MAHHPRIAYAPFSSGRDAKPGQRTLHQYVMDISSLGVVPAKR